MLSLNYFYPYFDWCYWNTPVKGVPVEKTNFNFPPLIHGLVVSVTTLHHFACRFKDCSSIPSSRLYNGINKIAGFATAFIPLQLLQLMALYSNRACPLKGGRFEYKFAAFSIHNIDIPVKGVSLTRTNFIYYSKFKVLGLSNFVLLQLSVPITKSWYTNIRFWIRAYEISLSRECSSW